MKSYQTKRHTNHESNRLPGHLDGQKKAADLPQNEHPEVVRQENALSGNNMDCVLGEFYPVSDPSPG